MNGRTGYESPQVRRFRSDLAAMERLQAESSVLRFRAMGTPAQRYLIQFFGRSLTREKGKIGLREFHEVEVKLGASYPRTAPELRWLTPIYHPNISEIGLVCLGAYGTHWVPSLHLDELCVMLWDMCRYHNYDIRSPYNRDAAIWVASQTAFAFPLDLRPLRDRRGVAERPAPAPDLTAPDAGTARPDAIPLDGDSPWILDSSDLPASPPGRPAHGQAEEVIFLD
ncbi:MAG: ubiquitin-conjugating enzyme E2 [Isosphaeraceae bacterium]